MLRIAVILVLIGLLVVSVGGNILLARQMFDAQADSDRLRLRAVQAEATRGSLQVQVDQARSQPQAQGTPGPGGAPAAPVPTVASAGPETALLKGIEDQVMRLRGLQAKNDVTLKVLDQNSLRQYFLKNFDTDYLPVERESDQKLLSTLGLLNQGDNVVNILLDVLQEQVIGVYNEEEKVMYVVGGQQFGPTEKDTFAHEYTHALQDQYFDLGKIAPKHPDNDDRSLALQALVEGDAVLIQRLWAQENLSADEINQMGQGGENSTLFSAPLFIREQLLFPYGDGFAFVRRLYQTGGYPAIDDVFRNPPESTEQILHPEKFRTREKPVVVALPDLASVLGAGWRTINANVMGELDLRLILEQLTDPTRAERGSGGWGGDRWALLEKDGRQALVLKTTWDTEVDARNFFDTFALAMRNRFSGAKQEEASDSRQALTAATAATEVRRAGQTVVAVISFDRASAEAVLAAVGPF